MLTNCNPHKETKGSKYVSSGWLRMNLYNLVLGIVVGLLLSLLVSAYHNEWIGLRGMYFHILYSVVIGLCVTNIIYLPQKLFKFNRNNTWLFLIIYYLGGIMGMLIAIELIYIIRAWLFNTEYHFFHLEDAKFSVIIVIIVCTIIYAYLSQKRILNAKIQQKDLDLIRISQMKTQAELAALQSKINPHFLYNSLNSIASLIHEDPDKAESMTLKLSKLFRYSINQNQEDLVTVKEEMEIVSTYLDIEKIRFEDRINFVLDIDEEFAYAKIPRFLIQPLVENALKHGLKNVAENAELTISIGKTENTDQLMISIADNGIPFPDELDIGYGLQSTYDKLTLLYDGQYEVQIINQPVKKITIQIPLKYG